MDDAVTVYGVYLLDHVCPGLQARPDGHAVGAGHLLADHRATGAGGAAQVAELKGGPAQCLAGDAVILLHHDGVEGHVLEGHRLVLAADDVELLGGGFLDGEAGGGLQLRHLVPAVPQALQHDLTAGVGEVGAQVVELAGVGVIAAVPHLELGPLDGAAGDAVHLLDGEGRLSVILEVDRVVPVGVEGDQLAGGVQQIGGGRGFLRDLIYPGQQILQGGRAVCPCLNFIHAVAVRRLHQEYGVRHRLPGVRVPLYHRQVGPDVVLQNDGGGLAGEQLHMALHRVDDVIRNRIQLLDRVHPRLQPGDQDFAVLIGGAVQIPAAVFNFSDTEGHAGQPGTVRAQLDEVQGGFHRVGEHEPGRLVGLQLDDPLGLVDDVAGAFQLGDHIGPGGQLGQVDLSVLVGGELRRAPGTVHRLNAEPGVGDHLGRVGAVHLDQPDSGLLVVEEVQLLDAVPGLQLDLLGGGVQHMAAVPGVHLLHPVGARLAVRQGDLAQGVRLIVPQQLPVPPDSERDAGHGFMALPVILNDFQAGQGLILDGVLHTVPGDNGGGIGLGITLPALRGGKLHDFVCPRLQLRECIGAAGVGGAGIGRAALNMFDLDAGPVQLIAGVRVYLDHPQLTIGLVPECDLGRLTVADGHLLGVLLREQVIPAGDFLRHGIEAAEGQGDQDFTLGVGGERADGLPVRAGHGEDGALQGDFRSRLQFDNFQSGIRGIILRAVGVIADGGHVQLHIVVQVADIVLQIAILVFLPADGVHGGVLCHGRGEGELDAPGLARHALQGIENFELAGVAVAGRLGSDGGDLVVVHVHDFRALRHLRGVGKGHGHIVVIYPGLTPNGKDLLFVLLPVDGHGIGGGLIRRYGHAGVQHVVVGGAPLVDVLGGGQDAVANVQLAPGQARGYFEVIDGPVGEQIAP